MKYHKLPRSHFPNKYYFFGSEDSTDSDVILEVDIIPPNKDTALQYMKKLKIDFGLAWNMTMAVIKDGNVVDTLPNKSSIDGLNNSLYYTYKYHVNPFKTPILRPVKRNELLMLYKCIRTILSNCTRVNKAYRNNIMPLKGIHPFENKILALQFMDFTDIDTFNNKYQADVDTWKIIAFYLGQFISFWEDGIEIYTKQELITHHPKLAVFIQRKQLTNEDKVNLQYYKKLLLDIIKLMNIKNKKQKDGFYSIIETESIELEFAIKFFNKNYECDKGINI